MNINFMKYIPFVTLCLVTLFVLNIDAAHAQVSRTPGEVVRSGIADRGQQPSSRPSSPTTDVEVEGGESVTVNVSTGSQNSNNNSNPVQVQVTVTVNGTVVITTVTPGQDTNVVVNGPDGEDGADAGGNTANPEPETEEEGNGRLDRATRVDRSR